MRIDRLHIENFKKFKNTGQPLELHPHFTLLVCDNGAGKTSVLDALAVALGLWHKAAPGSGWRNILKEEIRYDPVDAGDRTIWKLALPSKITVEGCIGNREGLRWTRMIRKGGFRTTNAEAREAEQASRNWRKRPKHNALSSPFWLTTEQAALGCPPTSVPLSAPASAKPNGLTPTEAASTRASVTAI